MRARALLLLFPAAAALSLSSPPAAPPPSTLGGRAQRLRTLKQLAKLDESLRSAHDALSLAKPPPAAPGGPAGFDARADGPGAIARRGVLSHWAHSRRGNRWPSASQCDHSKLSYT